MSPLDDTRHRHDMMDQNARTGHGPHDGTTDVIREHLAEAGSLLEFPQRLAPATAPAANEYACTHWERTLNDVKSRLRSAASERFEMGSAAGSSADATLSRLQADTRDCVIVLNHLHLKMVLEFRRLRRTERELLEVQAALARALTALQERAEEPR